LPELWGAQAASLLVSAASRNELLFTCSFANYVIAQK
jgi:hypothetical protein